MTREEAIKEIEILKEDYWDDDGYGHETKQYDDTMLALDMAIKALEQESILDKIKAEIEQRPYGIANDSVIQGMKYERADILKILDKYKVESGDNMGKTCRSCEYFLSSNFDKNVGVCTLENDICLVENAKSDWCDFYEEAEGEVEHGNDD